MERDQDGHFILEDPEETLKCIEDQKKRREEEKKKKPPPIPHESCYFKPMPD